MDQDNDQSPIDRANNLARSARSRYKKARYVIRGARSLVALEQISWSAWGLLLLIGFIGFVSFVTFFTGFSGGGATESVTEGLDCSSTPRLIVDPARLIISPKFPATIEYNGCNGTTFSWSATPNTGSFFPDNNSTGHVVYTPEPIASGSQNIQITLTVCNDTAGQDCNKYSTGLVVTPDATSITCGTGTVCLPADNEYCGTSSSVTGVCPVGTGRTCCKLEEPQTIVYTCPSKDYAACLKQIFNIAISGASDYEKKLTFQAVAYVARSPSWLQFFKNGGTLNMVYSYPGKTGCSAEAKSSTLLAVGSCENISFKYYAHFMGHELTHIVGARNPYLKNQFPLSSLRSKDPYCYDSFGYIKSYSLSGTCSIGKNINPLSESFAESAANYATYMYSYVTWSSCQTQFTNFKAQCPNTYAWQKENVFGGYEF